MKSKKTIIALIIIALLPSAYGIKTWLFAPKVNPNPQQKIVLHGTFPFDKGLTLAFDVNYRSTNPTCRRSERVFFLFEAAEVPRTMYIKPEIRKVGENLYETEIYLDYLESGFCEWKYAGVGYNISGGDITGQLYEGLGDIPKNAKYAELLCKPSKLLNRDRYTFICSIPKSITSDKTLAPAQLNFIWEAN